jgi:hypothetical protein
MRERRGVLDGATGGNASEGERFAKGIGRSVHYMLDSLVGSAARAANDEERSTTEGR